MARRKQKVCSDIGNAFRRADGRWVVPYQLAPNRWKQKTVPSGEGVRTAAQAETWVAEWLIDQRLQGKVPRRRERHEGPTVMELSEEFLRLRDPEDHIAAATKVANKSHFKCHILPEFGDVPVAGLPFEGKRLGAWVRRLKKERKLQTAKNIVSTFRVFLDWAMSPEAGELIAKNPVSEEWVKKLLPKRKKKDGRAERFDEIPLTVEQVQTLIACVLVPLARRVRYVLVFTLPARDGEIAGLRWLDVFLDAPVPYVKIRVAAALVGDDGHATLQQPKTEWSVRKIPLHPAAVAALREWKDEGWEMLVCRRPRPTDPVFPRPDGELQRPRSAEFLRADLETCELPSNINGIDVCFHDSRSCVGTWLTKERVHPMFVRRLLGQAPQGAFEREYLRRDDILEVLLEEVKKIPLRWCTSE